LLFEKSLRGRKIGYLTVRSYSLLGEYKKDYSKNIKTSSPGQRGFQSYPHSIKTDTSLIKQSKYFFI